MKEKERFSLFFFKHHSLFIYMMISFPLSIIMIQLTPKTVLEISSKEGREWGSDCKHICTSLMNDFGQSDFREGRTLPSQTPLKKTAGSEKVMSE